jgi:thiol-disulfide isomerase/thioredoxin
MLYLTVAVIAVGALGVLNLVLAMGIIKRLREQSRATGDAGPGVLPAGSQVGEFDAVALDGRVIQLSTMQAGAVVAFFSPTCQPCKELMPAFTDYALHHPGGRDQVFAIVVSEAPEAADLIERLTPVATVLTATRNEPIVTSFAASGYPALYLMGEQGQVMASGHSMGDLPELALR